MQQAWWQLTVDEEGVEVTEAVAKRVDMTGALDRADTTVTVEEDKAAGTGLHAHCLLLSLSALPWWRRIGAVGGGVGRRTAPGLPRWAVKETVHPPSLVHWCPGRGRRCPHRPKHGETPKQLPGLSAGWTSWLAILKQGG